jgi:hypothetical protein
MIAVSLREVDERPIARAWSFESPSNAAVEWVASACGQSLYLTVSTSIVLSAILAFLCLKVRSMVVRFKSVS